MNRIVSRRDSRGRGCCVARCSPPRAGGKIGTRLVLESWPRRRRGIDVPRAHCLRPCRRFLLLLCGSSSLILLQYVELFHQIAVELLVAIRRAVGIPVRVAGDEIAEAGVAVSEALVQSSRDCVVRIGRSEERRGG